MTQEDLQFRDRLVAAQTRDETLKGRHEQEIQSMLEHKLNRPVKWMLIAIMALCLLAAAMTAVGLLRLWLQTPSTKEMAICLLVLELAVAAYLGWITVRGSLRAGAHGFFLALICGTFSLCAAALLNETISGLPADLRPHGSPLPIVVLVLVLGWVPMVMVTISYYHTRTREKLLEIQYQLAELVEEVRGRR